MYPLCNFLLKAEELGICFNCKSRVCRSGNHALEVVQQTGYSRRNQEKQATVPKGGLEKKMASFIMLLGKNKVISAQTENTL